MPTFLSSFHFLLQRQPRTPLFTFSLFSPLIYFHSQISKHRHVTMLFVLQASLPPIFSLPHLSSSSFFIFFSPLTLIFSTSLMMGISNKQAKSSHIGPVSLSRHIKNFSNISTNKPLAIATIDIDRRFHQIPKRNYIIIISDFPRFKK